MRKEDIDAVAVLLTNLKDTVSELDSALKTGNAGNINAAKRKIADLQMQIGRKI